MELYYTSPLSVASLLLFTCFTFLVGYVRKSRYLTKLRTSPILNYCKDDDKTDVTQKPPNRKAEDFQQEKELYIKLQNLENHPEALPLSRDLLLSYFSESLHIAHNQRKSSILRIQHYTRQNLDGFMHDDRAQSARLWEEYIARRRAGGTRELLADRGGAKEWLKRHAPLKLVDGAWLGHINKVTTPFSLRSISKNAWQVLSEELGDGDIEKNHVYLYSQLLASIDMQLPDAHDPDFIHSRHGLDDVHIWRAGLVQLLISLFPNEFFPEILGFNLHFEGITHETLVASKELAELDIDNYYFILHISIDNAASGHTAMALETVHAYLEHIERSDGHAAAQQAWKRVQTGFLLSENATSLFTSLLSIGRHLERPISQSTLDSRFTQILQNKVLAANGLHCTSRIKIGSRKLVDWLKPEAFASTKWQKEFLDSLSDSTYWVNKGKSEKSRLVQLLSWKGKMFGAFTNDEVKVVKNWIDSLSQPDAKGYWEFSGRTEIPTSQATIESQIISFDYPVLKTFSHPLIDGSALWLPATLPSFKIEPKLKKNVDMSLLLPLWFSHPCLLESFICVPSRTTTTFGSSIIRVLRAQYGFSVENIGVSGMDEVNKEKSIGLVEIGLEIMEALKLPKANCLQDVLSGKPSGFIQLMLNLSMRPINYAEILLGLSLAFLDLHVAMASHESLSLTSREILSQIVLREKENMSVCLKVSCTDRTAFERVLRGYYYGKSELSCFFV